jgi:hypothetical protein
MNSFFLLRALRFFTLNSTFIRQFFFCSLLREEGSSLPANNDACSPPPTLYVANQGVTMKLRFGGKAVPT